MSTLCLICICNMFFVIIPVHCFGWGGYVAPHESEWAPWRWSSWWCSFGLRAESWWQILKRWSGFLSAEAASSHLSEAVSASPSLLLLRVVQQKGCPSARRGALWSPEAHPERRGLQQKRSSPPSPLHSLAPTHPSEWKREISTALTLLTTDLEGKHPCVSPLLRAVMEKGAVRFLYWYITFLW